MCTFSLAPLQQTWRATTCMLLVLSVSTAVIAHVVLEPTNSSLKSDRRLYSVRVSSTVRFVWTEIIVDKGDDTLLCAVEIETSSSSNAFPAGKTSSTLIGWVGFGVAERESGGMPGADVALVERLDTAWPTITDTWTSSHQAPVADPSNSQDWKLLGVVKNTTHTTISLSRKLKEGLNLEVDRPLTDNGVDASFILAFGSTATASYHGKDRRFLWSLNLFTASDDYDLFRQRTTKESGVQTLIMSTPRVQNDIFEYSRSPCYETNTAFPPDPTGQGREPFIIALSESWKGDRAHHWSLFGMETCNNNLPAASIPRNSPHRDPPQIALPAGIGYEMNRAPIWQLITHNKGSDPTKSNKGDVGNVTFYWKYGTAGVDIKAADMLNFGPGQDLWLPVGDSSYTVTFDEECTRASLKKPATLFDETFHTHDYGVAQVISFYRRNNNRTTADRPVEWQRYAFRKSEYADYRLLRHIELATPIVVHPGDIINVTCRYRTSKPIRAGLGSYEEMCMYFSSYFPADAHPMPTVTGGLRSCMKSSVVAGFGPELERREETWARLKKEKEGKEVAPTVIGEPANSTVTETTTTPGTLPSLTATPTEANQASTQVPPTIAASDPLLNVTETTTRRPLPSPPNDENNKSTFSQQPLDPSLAPPPTADPPATVSPQEEETMTATTTTGAPSPIVAPSPHFLLGAAVALCAIAFGLVIVAGIYALIAKFTGKRRRARTSRKRHLALKQEEDDDEDTLDDGDDDELEEQQQQQQ